MHIAQCTLVASEAKFSSLKNPRDIKMTFLIKIAQK